jgi:hypothetical protein
VFPFVAALLVFVINILFLMVSDDGQIPGPVRTGYYLLDAYLLVLHTPIHWILHLLISALVTRQILAPFWHDLSMGQGSLKEIKKRSRDIPTKWEPEESLQIDRPD